MILKNNQCTLCMNQNAGHDCSDDFNQSGDHSNNTVTPMHMCIVSGCSPKMGFWDGVKFKYVEKIGEKQKCDF